MRASLAEFVPAVKRAWSPDRSFPVSLRLSNAASIVLDSDEERLAELRDFLCNEDLYLMTANAFPYGQFKGGMVKEEVYAPDWSTAARVDYTLRVARILADVAPAGTAPTIQTAPLAFAPDVTGSAYVEAFTRNVLEVVASLVDLERATGRVVRLALEPEPHCFLATTPETVAYFESHLYSAAGARQLARAADVALSEAHGLLRRHLGLVFDICHQAVEFENMASSLASIADAGISVFKLQEAAALWVPEVDAERVAALERFAGTIYLTQTTQRRDSKLTRFLNLEDAISAWHEDPRPCEWRTHFHVPVFLDDLGLFRTTQFAIRDALAVHAAAPVSDQLEIETYTWDVLPDHLKDTDITACVIRELEWVAATLRQSAPSAADVSEETLA